jgi:hypothetical protein
MSDGTRIAVDIYMPRERETSIRFPALFNYHPYARAVIDPSTGQVATSVGGSPQFLQFFASHGYVIVIADMRGSGASYGTRLDMSPQLARDGKEIVDWIAVQPWCNGNVGMYGGSYAAWSQFATASQRPNALKCIMPEMGSFDAFDGGLAYSGGIYRRGLIEIWAGLMYFLDKAAYLPQSPAGVPLLPPSPVADEDGDGELADEIPCYPPRAPFFIFGPPAYSDGVKREDRYYNAVKEHLQNCDIREWAPIARFSNSRCASEDYTWLDIGAVGSWLKAIAESGVAVYNVGGWFDIFSRATTQWYCSLSSTNPSRMLVLPLTHGSLDLFPTPMAGPYLRYFKEDPALLVRLIGEERLRFFDRYLKGTRNGPDEEPPVLIYVMNGGGLRAEKEWPLKRQVATRYYLNAERSLNTGGPGEGEDEYQADLTHDSRQGPTNDSRWSGVWMGEDIIRRTEKHKKCITFTSLPLDCDVEVTGHPIISLWVASTGRDSDFFIYLEDTEEGGETVYVTEGMLRAGFCRMAFTANPDVPPVLPNLPYHSFIESDYVADLFDEGKKTRVLIDLYPTSWVFRKGHCIAVSIACADWPSYDLNPQLSPRNNPIDPGTTIPRITLYHNVECPSYIELPIIPRVEAT